MNCFGKPSPQSHSRLFGSPIFEKRRVVEGPLLFGDQKFRLLRTHSCVLLYSVGEYKGRQVKAEGAYRSTFCKGAGKPFPNIDWSSGVDPLICLLGPDERRTRQQIQQFTTCQGNSKHFSCR